MCKNDFFEFTSTCAYCLRKQGEEVDFVLPIHDWNTGKLLGYFCKEHYIKVKAQNITSSYIKQKAN